MSHTTPANQPVLAIVRAQAKPDEVEAAHSLLAGVVAPSRANPENLAFAAYQNTQDPAGFVLWEEWASPAALQAHNASDEMVAFTAQVKERFDSVDVDFYTAIDPAGPTG